MNLADKSNHLPRLLWLLLLCALFSTVRNTPLVPAKVIAQTTVPAAEVINDEGGPVVITGSLDYSNAFFTAGITAPMVILEDQAGFIDRDLGFILSPASQTLGQITSDFYTSPFHYSLALPIEPQGTLRDVDNDSERDTGVMVFAVAYWSNKFGDPFLEERDLFGGGWSTAYASTVVSNDISNRREIVGGKLVIYAPNDQQAFPDDFGPDTLLFTADDPTRQIPQGYTVVNLDTSPFTFDRSHNSVIDLIEPDVTALVDFSSLGYVEAFDALIEKLRREYAFTEYKGIDWDALHTAYAPRFLEADANRDVRAYRLALRDFAYEIPDGHIQGPLLTSEFRRETSGGIGLAIRELDDGRVVVTYLLPNGPAAEAGIRLRAEIIAIDGQSIQDYLEDVFPWSGPFSTPHTERLQKLRYAVRFPVGTAIEITYRNPEELAPKKTRLLSIEESESLNLSSFNAGLTGFELPLEYELLESGYGYVKLYSFLDNEVLTVQLWERLMQMLNEYLIPGLVIDLRQNGGGYGFLADQMAAYFFDEPLELGNTGHYHPKLDDFYFDPRTVERFYLPADDLRYDGEIVVLVGPNCSSACEFFAYALTRQDRATVVGHYPTAGLGGGVVQLLMPGRLLFQFTNGRAVDMAGEIHIEGKGIIPTIRVPITEETLLAGNDVLLDAAIDTLDSP